MKIYLQFLKSLLKHKYYVFIAGRKLGIGFWQLFIHDWQKFTPAEFPKYARYFFRDKSNETYRVAFMYAWLHHVQYGKHHWEHWLLNPDYNFAGAENGCLPMPHKYIKEMVVDWLGASKAYTGSWDMTDWLGKNLDRMYLHTSTRDTITTFLLMIDNGKML